MNATAADEVGLRSRQQADLYISKGNFGRAFAHLLVAIKLKPNWKNELKETFSNTIGIWSDELERQLRFKDLFTCYEQAIEVFPENEVLYKNLGHILFRAGSPKEASDYLRKYVAIDPWDLAAVYTLDASNNLAVERWHFRMLNDDLRNEAFREAIVKRIRQGYTSVLDIGSGTGILSLFAAEAKAEQVVACESSPAMSAIAAEVLTYYKATEVTLLTKHSTDLIVGDNIPARVSMVVSEVLDCGLLGEGVLPTLIDAWERLLDPSGVVVPSSASLHVCGLQAPKICQTWALRHSALPPGLENLNVIVDCEGYDTECLQTIMGGFKKLTTCATPLEVNFNDPVEMKAIVAGQMDCSITLTGVECGSLDCLAVWFTLGLDNEITLETGPDNPIRCWEQAIFPNPHRFPVQVDQDYKLSLAFQSGRIVVTFPETNSVQRRIIVSQKVARFLNNSGHVHTLQAAGQIISSENKKSIRILDMSPFPVLGLELLKARAPKKILDQLVCGYDLPGEKEIITHAATALGISKKVLCIDGEAIDALIQRQQKFDVIVLAVVEDTGELKSQHLQKLTEIKKCLRPGGRILPEQLTIIGQLVESDWLIHVSQVKNSDVTCGYNVAPFVNMYSTDHQIDFQMPSISAAYRTRPFQLLELPLLHVENSQSTIAVGITSPGYVNGIVYWYRIIYLKQWPTETTISTNDDSSLINQAAFLVSARAERELIIEMKYQDGMFRARISN